MKNDKTLAWLLDEEWKPKQVKKFIGMSNQEFDEYEAHQYGYKSYKDMITQSNKKHQENKLRYGDMYIKGWM